jgi:alpha-beta hydrolase superfamily lysophospholipase
MTRIKLPGKPEEFLTYTLTLPRGTQTPDSLVVYLHGFASHQRGEKVLYFRDRFVEMGAAYLAFDHRGHGSSSGTMKDLTIARNLEDIDSVMKAKGMNFKKRVLVGSSMGGQTAAWYAARRPDLITANLLIAPGFRFLQNRLKELGPKGLKKLKADGQITIQNEWVEVTIGKELLDDARHFTMDKLVKKYRTPTIILHGTEDGSVPFQDSLEFIQRAKTKPLDLLLIAGGDHRLTNHKDVLFEHMYAFCKRIGIF